MSSPLSAIPSDTEDNIPDSDDTHEPDWSQPMASRPVPFPPPPPPSSALQACHGVDSDVSRPSKRARVSRSPAPLALAGSQQERALGDASPRLAGGVLAAPAARRLTSLSPQKTHTRRPLRTTPQLVETERFEAKLAPTASQDLAFWQSTDFGSAFDDLPSSDPAPLPPPIRSPSRRPPKRSLSINLPPRADALDSVERIVHADAAAADDSGVFMMLDKDEQQVETAQNGLLTLADDTAPLLAEEDDNSLLLLQSDGVEDFDNDDMWDAFNENDLDMAQMTALDAKGKGKVATPKENDEDDPYADDAADSDAFSFGVAAAAGWDPSKAGVFQLASKKPVQLSEDALRKAAALFDDLSEDVVMSASPAPPPARHVPSEDSAQMSVKRQLGPLQTQSTPNRAHLPPPLPLTTPASFPVKSPARLVTTAAFTGFSTGSGAAVAPPSEAAMIRARAVFATQHSSSPPAAAAPEPLTSAFAGFRTAAGAAVAPPSEEAIARARGTISSSPVAQRVEEYPDRRADVFTAPEEKAGGTFTLLPPTTTPVALVASPAAAEQPAAVVGTSSPVAQPVLHHRASEPSPRPVASTSTAIVAPPPLPRPTFSSSQVASVTAFRSPMLSRPTGTGFRSPMLSTAANANRVHTSTPVKQSLTTQAYAKAAPAVRRLNLGMTPRARLPPGTPGAPILQQQQKFHTPFKGGKRPEGLTPAGLKTASAKAKLGVGVERSRGANGPPDSKGKGKGLQPRAAHWIPIFDLEAKGDRQSLSEFGMRPMTHFYESLEALNVPESILDMDATSAKDFVFPCGRGPLEAHQALANTLNGDAQSLASLKWVKNHWSLIVWKLASYIRSRPDLLGEWWNWEWVLRQLEYRYEREVNRAERSCIKRIQEQDSPASLPMILCVSEIRWEEGAGADPLQATAAHPPAMIIAGLELTDGWYRIRSNVDQTLRHACERGKIVVGSKLAIVGARIDSSREGTDVLVALGRSSLVISGNSTSLAPWHARLGFQQQSVVASLGSLTSDGGVASLLDLVVERVFPYGYVDMSKNSSHGTWNEEEEHVRADEWKRGREKAQARMADEMEKAGTEWDLVLDLLRDAQNTVGPPPTGSPDADSNEEEPDEILDRLEDATATDKASIVRKLNARQVHGSLQLAGERSMLARNQAVNELEKELATSYPPRDVRGFRVLRVRDARLSDANGKTKAARTAQLTVWDANTLGADFFQPHQRYLLTNIMPKGSWKRQSTELALATRRDSRWSKVER